MVVNLIKFNSAKYNLYANYRLSRNTSVIKVDGKVINVTIAACFLRTREFGDCGEFRGITEFVSLDQCKGLFINYTKGWAGGKLSNIKNFFLSPPPPHGL